MTVLGMSTATTVSVGDIRFVRCATRDVLPSGVHTRLILVLNFPLPQYVHVILVTEDVHMAGPFDITLTQRELGMDLRLCAQTDLVATLPVDRLGILVTTLDTSVLDIIRESCTNGEFPEGPVADLLERGLPLGSPLDPRWQFKLLELEDLQRL